MNIDNSEDKIQEKPLLNILLIINSNKKKEEPIFCYQPSFDKI